MPQSDVYLGNPNLKKANTEIQFTEENVKEFLKCKDDPVYFARKYIKFYYGFFWTILIIFLILKFQN